MPFHRDIRSFIRKNRHPKWSSATHNWALHHALKQISMLKEAGIHPEEKNVLEIGTGWSPIAPIIYSLAGAKLITTIDIDYCLSEDAFFVAVAGITKNAELVANRMGLSKDKIEQKLRSLHGKKMDKALLAMNIEYRPDCNIIKDFSPDYKYDIICSRAVLEHIDAKLVINIMEKCRELIADNGRVLHIIDNSDHWEHQDKSISRVNFLYHSDFFMSILNKFNPQDYQNRLRNYEYIDIFKKSGFDIILNDPEVHSNTLNSLEYERLNKKYKGIKREELAAITSYIVCAKSKLH
jgi:2-polyprenyl-3-methyl-5-hydroxy-6-metoxy-1,4-benzoquinol methylase